MLSGSAQVKLAGVKLVSDLPQTPETIMKRTIFALLTTAIVSLAVAPAYANDIDFKTNKGIEKFWAEHPASKG